MDNIERGILLVSEPFMKDPGFMRTVVLLCEHHDESSFGLVLNRPIINININIGTLFPEIEKCTFPILYGGPVAPNSLHFIHRCPRIISSGDFITDEIFWGGDFEEVKELLLNNKLKKSDIKFFAGYSGWGNGQLEEEINTGSWLTTQANSKLVLDTEEKQIWKEALKQMGGEYEQMINYPIDPTLN